MKVANGHELSLLAIADGLNRPPDVNISDFADAHRILPSEGASEPGKWRTSRTPFLKEIMDCLSLSHPSKRVVFMASAQTGKTEVGINLSLHTMATQTVPMLVVQPTVEIGKLWSTQRLSSAIALMPSLENKMANKSRDGGNTILMKSWPGGVLRITGANSASGLRAMPVRILFFDEVDAAPLDIEGEGDPVKLAEARTTTFQNRKIFLSSTPTNESSSRIYKSWLQSDQRRYFISCPYCQFQQYLVFENLRWQPSSPETALYHCSDCGTGIEEHHKTSLLAGGEWKAQAVSDSVGFHLNGLYAPTGLGYSWIEIAAEWERIKNDPAQVKTFKNVRLGEVTADPTERLDEDELFTRREPYRIRTVPNGVCVLTAGVDVQKNRLAAQITGWSRGNSCSIIDYTEIMGDPTRPEVWLELEKYLSEPLLNKAGFALKVKLTAVDTGYLIDEVLNFVRPRRNKGYFAIKGSSIAGKSIISTRPGKVDMNWKGVVQKGGAEIWAVGSDTGKATIFARLSGDREKPETERLFHFSDDLNMDYFRMLTAEVFDTDKQQWHKIRRENEALDTLVYATAAAMHPLIRVHTWTDKHWTDTEAKLTSQQLILLDQAEADNETKPEPPKPEPQPIPPPTVKPWNPKKSFATNW